MTQPHNKAQPQPSKLQLRLEVARQARTLTWDQCYILIRLEAMLKETGPESNFAAALVTMLQD
jgi:hypothetical protein